MSVSVLMILFLILISLGPSSRWGVLKLTVNASYDNYLSF